MVIRARRALAETEARRVSGTPPRELHHLATTSRPLEKEGVDRKSRYLLPGFELGSQTLPGHEGDAEQHSPDTEVSEDLLRSAEDGVEPRLRQQCPLRTKLLLSVPRGLLDFQDVKPIVRTYFWVR